MKIVLVIVYLILSTSGLIFMKLGGNTGSLSMNNGNIVFGINPVSLLGLCCYIFSFLLYTRIVLLFDLSYITPICTGIIQILTLISSKIVFKENITIQGIVGASIIIIGLLLMNWKK